MEFEKIKEMVFEEYKKNGYLDHWELNELKSKLSYIDINYDVQIGNHVLNELQLIADVAEVGLINTEVSELIEDIRKDEHFINQMYECADIIIRVMNYASRKNIDLEKMIIAKHKINMERKKLHGKKV